MVTDVNDSFKIHNNQEPWGKFPGFLVTIRYLRYSQPRQGTAVAESPHCAWTSSSLGPAILTAGYQGKRKIAPTLRWRRRNLSAIGLSESCVPVSMAADVVVACHTAGDKR